MWRLGKISILLVFLSIAVTTNAQGPKEKTVKQELKSNRQMRAEGREKRKKERAERKAVKKYHKRLQTKQVRKRMKTSRKAAIRYNNNKREFFLVRWFKKHKTGK